MTNMIDPFNARQLRETLLAKRPMDAVAIDRIKQTYRDFYNLSWLPFDEHRWGCVRSDDYEVVYQTFIPRLGHKDDINNDKAAGGCFYLLHGYYDHVGLYAHLIHFLLSEGYEVVAIDLPGHGLSSGPRASIISFDEYSRALWQVMQLTAQQRAKPLNLIGQSTGGAVVIDWLLRSPFKTEFAIDKAVLLAPLVKPWNWTQGLLSFYLLSPFTRRLKRRYSRNSHNDNFLRFLQDDPLQPRYLAVDWVRALSRWIPAIEAADPVVADCLIIQGEEDRTVDWPINLDILQEKFPDAEIHRYPIARHHLVNERADIREQWMAALRRYLT
ncbi:alpha/beta hydrolase [Oceanospirillum maris]|uniref:alpha/beta hydrolase n=1 Tax=Oceanospirillum maris TaxID=64977 RepID=UPI00041A900E|nr:alpha/beta hydrolase [Oceanospirillum maris]